MTTGINHLKDEKSPYLKQHASNPVWWYAWGDDAFRQAKAQNKLIFLSIGYSTCHWCHVMERESYEQHDVAEVLNKTFISIKVDREERPDVDAIYMDAVQAMTGSGGWPLNIVLTPDRKPFFGGTYFQKSQLLNILGQISEAWQKTPDKVSDVAKRLGDFLKDQERQANAGEFTNRIFSKFFKMFKDGFDPKEGGRKGKPKFVPSYDLRVLVRIHRRADSAESLRMVQKTLDQVARGGIYDHLGGGFHRYSTDDKWLVPHFEKMLYDQAALVNAYLETYQETKNSEYKEVVRETLDYVLKDLTSPGGGFYSAEDADSEGVEGKFYVWKENELKKILTAEEFEDFSKSYGISSGGNFEGGTNILNLQPGFFRSKRSKSLQTVMDKLNNVRAKRIRPSLDGKILTSWNGLMISAMAKAARVLNEDKYAVGASRAADFVLSHMRDKSQHLMRRWADGEAKFDPYDEDYAFLIDGFIELYQTTFDKKWLLEAVRLQEDQDKLFWDSEKGGYFLTTGNDKSLLRRGKNFFDNVTPSGNSVSVLNLLRLSDLMVNPQYKEKAVRIMKAFPKEIMEYPIGFPQLLMAADYGLDRSKEIAIIGNMEDKMTKAFVTTVNEGFRPNQVISVGPQGGLDIPLLKNRPMVKGRPTGYVCINQVCRFPTNDVTEVGRLAEERSKYKLEF